MGILRKYHKKVTYAFCRNSQQYCRLQHCIVKLISFVSSSIEVVLQPSRTIPDSKSSNKVKLSRRFRFKPIDKNTILVMVTITVNVVNEDDDDHHHVQCIMPIKIMIRVQGGKEGDKPTTHTHKGERCQKIAQKDLEKFLQQIRSSETKTNSGNVMIQSSKSRYKPQ